MHWTVGSIFSFDGGWLRGAIAQALILSGVSGALYLGATLAIRNDWGRLVASATILLASYSFVILITVPKNGWQRLKRSLMDLRHA
jgi:hypothetical protein